MFPRPRLLSRARGLLLGALFACALVPAGAAPPKATAPAARREPKPFVWPTPKLLQGVDVPETLKVQGIPSRLRAVLLDERADVLLQLYADAFVASGFYIPPVRHQPQLLKEPMLTALDPRRGVSYTVILQPHPNGTTTAVLGEANLALRDKPGADVAPIFPGAKDVLRTDQEGARLVVYEAAAKPAEVEAFYRDVLAKAGYSESEEPADKGTFKKGGSQLQVLVREKGPAQTSVVVIARGTP